MADRVQVPISQVDNPSRELQNGIFSTLLSSGRINNIEAILEQELQRTGFADNLKQYILHLLRTKEASSTEEIVAKVFEKMQADTASKGPLTGNAVTNGNNSNSAVTSTNGLNGNGALTNGRDTASDIDLRISNQAVTETTKVVAKELDKVCDFIEDDVDGEEDNHNIDSLFNDLLDYDADEPFLDYDDDEDEIETVIANEDQGNEIFTPTNSNKDDGYESDDESDTTTIFSGPTDDSDTGDSSLDEEE